MGSAPRTPHPLILLLAAWAVPGLGHFLLHRRFRAGVFAVATGGLFWLGISLSAHLTMPGDAETFALFKFLGAVGSGAHYLLARLLGFGVGDVLALKEALTNEHGITCLYTAGIINVLAVADALEIRAGRRD